MINGKSLFASALFLSIFLSVSASSVAGVWSQEYLLPVNSTEVSQLVSVGAQLNFSNLIPGQEYSVPVNVSWSVPENALINLNSSQVIVYVVIRPANASSSWLYFKDSDGNKASSAVFQLVCVLQNSSCNPSQSVLFRQLNAYYFEPQGATYPHDDELMVNASILENSQLSSIAGYNESVPLQQAALNALGQAGSFLQATGGAASQKALDLLNQAKNTIESGDYLSSLNSAKLAENASQTPTPTPQAAVVAAAGTGNSFSSVTGLIFLRQAGPYAAGIFILLLACGLAYNHIKGNKKRDLRKRSVSLKELGNPAGVYESNNL